jgi:hypothetical protein
MKNPLCIVVEGQRDAGVLRQLLPEEFSNSRFFAAGGRSSVVTLARNILVHEGGHVLIVADADTDDQDQAQKNRNDIQDALRRVAPQQHFDVFLFVPEMEVIFFEYPSVLETLQPQESTDLGFGSKGRNSLRDILLNRLRKQKFEDWTGTFSQEIWKGLRNGKQAKSLLQHVSALVSAQNTVRDSENEQT